jgi:tRNA(Ile)-lysidine synthase
MAKKREKDGSLPVSVSVRKVIIEHGLIRNGDLVLVGVSGGADSLCLLHVLHGLSRNMGFTVAAVHVNHMLRGAESDMDEEFVRNICCDWRIDLSICKRDVKALAAREGISIEAAAREARYGAFDICMKEKGADRVAVAHNKNDQAETVLMNLVRGSGLEGLTGMDYIRGRIIRPLLNEDRHRIEEYCRENNLFPRTDSSNFDNAYTRNRVRNQLIPLMREVFEADPVESIARMALLLKEDSRCLESEASRIFESSSAREFKDGKTTVKIGINTLIGCPKALSSRLVRMAVGSLKSDVTGLEKKHIDDVLLLARCGKTGSIIQLPQELTVEKGYGELIFCQDRKPGRPARFQEELKIPGVTHIGERGLAYEVELLPADDVYGTISGLQAGSFTQYFDYERLKSGINIRNRRNGDVFMPLNAPGERKLKDYFIDRKVPRAERDLIPLVAVGKEIVWVTGHNISDKFKVTENTKTVLKIKCLELGADRGLTGDEHE